MIPPLGFRIERGLVWPAADRDCAAVVFDFASDIEIALKHCRARDVVVQAGGNCGVWPLALGQEFRAVFTFEPDAENYEALRLNTLEVQNIIRFQAALGCVAAPINLVRQPENCGAHFVGGGGKIPVFLIDELDLSACDLIMLDVEGQEMQALKGAVDTIRQFRPTIAFEDKGLSERYGVRQGEIEKWLAGAYGYRVVERPHRDVVMIPS